MKRRYVWSIVGTCLLLAAGAALLWRAGGKEGQAARAGFDFRYDWPAGTELTYALDWEAAEAQRLPSQRPDDAPARSRQHFTGKLVLRSYGRGAGDAFTLTARLEGLSRHELDFWGRAPLADDAAARAQLEGHAATLTVTPSGAVRSVGFAADAPDLFKHLMQTLLTEAQVPVPAAPDADGTWEAEEPSRFGLAQVHYEAVAATTLHRERTGYRRLHALSGEPGPHSVTSRGVAELAPAGHLTRLHEEETLAVRSAQGGAVLDATVALTLALERAGRFDAVAQPLAASVDLRTPGQVEISDSASTRLLEQRAAGMTGEMLVGDLRQMANGGLLPEHNRWLWRATGLLKLHPELARELLPLLLSPATNATGRALVLDLLAGAGTSEAQAVMREALDRPALTQDKAYPLLLQRFSLVAEPDAQSAAFLARVSEQSRDVHVQRAGAMSLGSVIGKLQDQPAVARSHLARLTAEASGAQDPATKATLLRAVGNAGMPESEPMLRGLATEPSPEVRAAVASALRRQPSEAATRTLVTLVQDAHPGVAETAMTSLGERVLPADALGALTAAALAGKTPEGSERALVTLLHAQRLSGADVDAALRAVQARTQDGDLRARIESLLQEPRLAARP